MLSNNSVYIYPKIDKIVEIIIIKNFIHFTYMNYYYLIFIICSFYSSLKGSKLCTWSLCTVSLI